MVTFLASEYIAKTDGCQCVCLAGLRLRQGREGRDQDRIGSGEAG